MEGEWSFYTGTYDAATNLAVDELMLDKAKRGERSLRIYGFERPSVILARNESYSDVKTEEDGVEYTRRDTGGSVIYCDDSAVFYSVAMPVEDEFPEHVHREVLGPRIAEALVDAGVPADRVGIGEHFSVRIDGRTVSGNSQRKAGGGLLYQGLIAVEPWDEDRIDELISLRERGQHEREFIASLPGVVEYLDVGPADARTAVRDALRGSFTRGDYREEELSGDEKERAEALVDDKYGTEAWLKGEEMDGLKEDQGFCFVDWTDEWDEDVRSYGFY